MKISKKSRLNQKRRVDALFSVNYLRVCYPEHSRASLMKTLEECRARGSRYWLIRYRKINSSRWGMKPKEVNTQRRLPQRPLLPPAQASDFDWNEWYEDDCDDYEGSW